MSDILRHKSMTRKQAIELSHEESAQLNAIIDLLIPSDDTFPAPSSLHLIDAFLSHLLPSAENKTTLVLNEQRLRLMLHDLNIAAGGCFCKASIDKQQVLLRQLEQRDPAFFQALWTFANHSYYTFLAKRQSVSRP